MCQQKIVDTLFYLCYDEYEFEERSENMIRKFKQNYFSSFYSDCSEKTLVFSRTLL